MTEEDFKQEMISELGQQLLNHFPNTDVRVNWSPDIDMLRLLAPEYSDDAQELYITGADDPQQLLYHAILAVKELIGKFDA